MKPCGHIYDIIGIFLANIFWLVEITFKTCFESLQHLTWQNIETSLNQYLYRVLNFSGYDDTREDWEITHLNGDIHIYVRFKY